MKTVFLIDDDEDDRDIFEEALRALAPGVVLKQAFNGVDAFEKLEQEGFPVPDLVFLDLNMPKMDGREFLRQIKKKEQFKHIPIVIYSTSSNAGDIAFAKHFGAADFMTKHHSIADLRTGLQQMLDAFLP